MDQLPRLGKRELVCLLLFTCNYVDSVGEISSSSGCLVWATLFYCGIPWAFYIIMLLCIHWLVTKYYRILICKTHNIINGFNGCTLVTLCIYCCCIGPYTYGFILAVFARGKTYNGFIDHYFRYFFFKLFFVCFVVAIFDLLQDMEAIFPLP